MVNEKKELEGFPLIKTHVAGIDVGAAFHVVAIPENLSKEPVRTFPSISEGIKDLCEFLKEHKIEEAALEATGIYFVPLLNALESYGIKPVLLNPHSLKGSPRKKSDVLDCQWILKNYSHGFGSACFVPDDMTAGLRVTVRGREQFISTAADCTNRMIKSLRLMNINLEMAVSDVQGASGMRIITSIVNGERDPVKLASLRDYRCKKSEGEIAKYLDGIYTEPHVNDLKANLCLYEQTQKIIKTYDDQILDYLRTMPTSKNYDEEENSYNPENLRDKINGKSKIVASKITGDLIASEAHRILGVDLQLVEGIGPTIILVFLSEIGTNTDSFETAGALASYLGLCPCCNVSGGKELSNRTKKVNHRLAKALRLAALSLWRSKSWLGAYCRKMRARQGTPKAITTTAHKLLRLIFGLIKNGKEYVTNLVEAEEAKNKEFQVKKLLNKAIQFGYKLVEIEGVDIPAIG
jgi:transposase